MSSDSNDVRRDVLGKDLIELSIKLTESCAWLAEELGRGVQSPVTARKLSIARTQLETALMWIESTDEFSAAK